MCCPCWDTATLQWEPTVLRTLLGHSNTPVGTHCAKDHRVSPLLEHGNTPVGAHCAEDHSPDILLINLMARSGEVVHTITGVTAHRCGGAPRTTCRSTPAIRFQHVGISRYECERLRVQRPRRFHIWKLQYCGAPARP